MESIEAFMGVFKNYWEDNNIEALVRIFKDAPDFLQNVPKSDIERALETIFDERKGLFKFIQTILSMPKNQMTNFKMPLKEVFNLVQSIMEIFQEKYESYILQTWEMGFFCIKTLCWFYARKTASETLKKLVELFASSEQLISPLNQIIDYYNDNYLRLCSRKDDCVFYIVLGAIFRYCPKIENAQRFADKLFLNLTEDLKNQIQHNNKKQPEEIKIYIDCYSDILKNFIPFEESQKQSVYFEKLYSYLSILCEPNGSQKTLRNKVVHFITTHIKHFSSFIFYDHEKWHKLLNNILDENENISAVQALRTFYHIIALHLLKENHENIFLYFKNYFMLNLSNRNVTSYRSRFIIYGLGEFSTAYNKYSETEIHEIFQMVSIRTLPFHTKENEMNKDFDAIVDYLQALSQILCQLPCVSLHHINIVMELSVLFAKRFPELKEVKKKDATDILISTFVNMSRLDKSHQNEYFQSFVREGILWSCSHALYIDVEFQKNTLENVPEQIFTYKDYLPLWQSIFTINHQKQYSNILVLKIFDVFVSVLISSIEKLNLNIKAQENNIFSDMSFSFKAENETDFRFFINLIDLCVEIFEEVDAFLLQNWMENLLVYLIKISYKNPWISGFYKIFEVILKKVDVISIDEEVPLNKTTVDLIFQYLLDVIQFVYKFTGELQLSCIYLILNAPLFFVKNLIDQTIPIFKIAFNIGLTDLSVASSALDTLENWIENSDINCSKDFLKAVVSYIEPYMSNEESKIDQIQSSIIRKKKKDDKLTEFNENDESLEALQKRILLFYGSLDLSALFEFVHEKSIATDATWNKKDLVPCDLLFPGTRLEIHLDKFIPRIIELTNSGDRRLKLSACELLHTVVTMMLGKNLMDQCFDNSMYRSLLRLSCDSDDTVRNLYHPFLIQLTHYLSSNATKASQRFIDSLFEGLSEKLNTLLRDHCALYLKEFITWSSQHSMDENDPMIVPDVNVKGVIRRIINFALYPSNEKRLGAAIAFDHLHPIFQSSVTILNTYWLEFFYAFVKCLEECDDAKIVSVLDRIVSDIKMKSELFSASSRDRRLPTVFDDGTLNGVLVWLFNQCTSKNLKSRRKCMEIFEKLLQLSSTPETIKSSLANQTGTNLLKSLQNEKFSLTVENIKTFLTILEVYIWILEKKFLPFENFFNKREDKNIFTNCFTGFISEIIAKHEEISGEHDEASDTKVEELENLSSQAILKILEFVTTLIKESKDSMEELHWDDSLYLLIARCILFPNKVGITADKLKVNEKLPFILQDLLVMMNNSLSETDTIKFREKIVAEAIATVAQFTDIQSIIHDNSNIQEFRQLLKGLSILKKSNFLDFEKEFRFTQMYLEDVINRVFTALKIEVMNSDVCKKIEEDVKEYLIEILTFFLEKYHTETVELLVKLINTDFQLTSLTGSTITHGEYFLELFKVPVFQYMLNDPAETMNILDNFFDQYPDKMLQLIEDLLTFVQHEKGSLEKQESLADTVITRFSVLQRLINDIEHRRKHFLNIYRLAVNLKTKPVEAMKTNGLPNELYTWILGELLRNKSLEHKTLFLRYFLIALTDENSSEVNPELSIVFQELRDNDGNTWLEKVKSDEVLKFQAASCFQVLLKMLVMTKSLFVFQAIIKFSAGVYKYMHQENVNEYLTSYFARISDVNAQKSLQSAYKIFWDSNSFRERLDVLKIFLIPSIEASKSDIVELFYDDHFHEMALCIKKEIDCSAISRASDRVKLIVSKIGCYNLFELLHVKFPLKKPNFVDPESKGQKPLNQFLVQQAMLVRSYSAKSQEEKEPARLLHCAALNCCISLISLKSEENFYKFIFFEDRKKNQLIWERIVDCEREYRLEQAPTTLRKERKKLINIRSSSVPAGNASASYFHRYNLTSLTLLEDVHAYDLNNIRVLSQARPEINQEQRLNLGFDDDQLNEHECMPMFCGVLIHMFNTGISELPSDGRQFTADDLPLFLRLLRNAFASQQPNVQLFLFKLLTNTSKAFLPYMAAFFAAIAGALCSYLSSRNLNYVIRDTLLLLIESSYLPQDEQDRRVAQRLLQRLVERVPAVESNVRKYNFELLEAIWSKWSSVLEWPTFPEDDTLEPEVLTWIVLTGLRAGGRRTAEIDARLLSFVRHRLEGWREDESNVLAAFEAFGWLLRDAEEERCREETSQLVSLFIQIEKRSRERCAQCVCALYKASRSEVLLKPLLRFVEARRLADGQRIGCLRLLADRLAGPGREEAAMPAELLRLGLHAALAERWPGCEGPALQSLRLLLPLLSENELRPLLKLAAGLAAPRSLSLLEHRRQALELLSEAWKILPSDSPSIGLCASALLSVLEPGEPSEVQDLALATWRERLPESRSAYARLLGLLSSLRGYEVAQVGAAAARLLCLLLLELAAQSPGAERPMFRPLMDGLNFREYQPLATYRGPSLGSMAPLFAPSLAASWTQASLMGSLQLTSFENSVQPTQSGFLIPEPSQSRLSLRTQSTQQVTYRRRDYQMQLRKERQLARRNVRLHRKYRLGDVPDVEITYSSFVESLRQFVLRDWLSCREFAVELIYQLIENSRGCDDHETLLSNISTALDGLPQDPDAQDEFGLILLEVGLRCKAIRLDAVAAARLCRSSGLNSLGTLLLEEKLVPGEEKFSADEFSQLTTKRMRASEPSDQQIWMQLVELQKALVETDTVTGILCREGLFSSTLKQAAKAQAAKKWLEASNLYEEGYEISMGSEKNHCLEGMFECMSELSSWDLINRKIDNILSNKYDRIWEEKGKQQLLPWLLEAQLQQTLEEMTSNKDLTNEEFLNQFESWIRKGQSIVKKPFGDHVSVFYLSSLKNQLAGQFLKNNIDHWKEQWIRLSPLSEKLKIRILTRLRGIQNINAYLQTVKSSDVQTATAKLIRYWDRHLPSVKQDLLNWNKLINYRLSFTRLLHEQVANVFGDDPLLKELDACCARQRMKISELAMLQENKAVARKHTQRAERILQEFNVEYADLNNEFHLIASKYKLISSQTESNHKKKLKYLLASWDITENLITDENVENSLKMKAHHHLFDVIESIKDAVENNEEFRGIVVNDPNIVDKLEIEEEENLINALRNYGFNSLKTACELESDGNDIQLAESYTKLGKYCYSLLRHFRTDNTVCLNFISSILSGMSFGSLEATEYFPSLLKYEYYRDNEEARHVFISKSEQVPSWLFIAWQAQILSNLDKSMGQLLIPIVKRLVCDYPNAIIYNFHQTYEASPKLKDMPEIRSMYEILFRETKIKTFFEAMYCICQPEQYLKHHIEELLDSKSVSPELFDNILKKVFPLKSEKKSLQGPLFKELEKYHDELTRIKQLDFEIAKVHLQQMVVKLLGRIEQRLNENRGLQLKDYCPYLNEFTGEEINIEIPGQYNGLSKPLPRYHAKISKLDRFVTVMKSKCNPIKINFIGNDAKVYGFLVKYGEDLRQDQRLQQTFNLMNKILEQDKNCSERYLSINTYHVVPLSTSLGLIQWIDETKTLKEFIKFSMKDENLIETVSLKYKNWIEAAGKSDFKTNSYKKAVVKYSPKDVICKMREFIKFFECDSLRKTFIMLSSSLDCFVSLRQNFTKSYATMCIIHWITGIGDRHLENMLIEVKTANCYGIDFGSAFGMGIDQSVPELVPFRLTPQILGLLQPYSEQGLLAVTMTHVLSALQNKRTSILACLDIFVHEPLDWSKHIKKQMEDTIGENKDVIKWLPKKKIAFVEKKLSGGKPSTIMLEELSSMHDDEDDDDENQCFSKYKLIINGTDSHQISIRSKLSNELLTTEEQVQCLLEQAKDLNVLGRMYYGWCPFV